MLAEIQREWDIAEEELKRCEQVALKASVPAINELRYAGRRVIDALNADVGGKAIEEVKAFLDDARFNCHRARHDAIDAALDTIAIDLELMAKHLGYAAMLKAYPQFPALFADFAKARAQIANSRRDRENRIKIYDSIAKVDFVSIADRYAELKTCRPIALAFSAKARLQRLSWWFMLTLTLCSLTIGVLSYRNAREMRLEQEGPEQPKSEKPDVPSVAPATKQ